MHFRNVLHLCLGVPRISRHPDVAYMRLRSGPDLEIDIDLLYFRVPRLLRTHLAPVVAVLFQQSLDILGRPIELFCSEEFAQLKLGGINHLVLIRTRGRTLDRDIADEVVGTGYERQRYSAFSNPFRFHANIRKAPGSIERLNALAHAFAVQRLSGSLLDHLQQARALAVGNAGESYLLHRESLVIRRGECHRLRSLRG